MSTEAHDVQPATPEDEAPLSVPEVQMLPPGTEPGEPAVPPVLSGKAMLRKGFTRWLVMGGIRWLYRRWTRIAVYAFPEDSKRAAFAARIGIPLPDQLNMSWVTTNLAVGGRILPADIHRLATAGVTCVVDTRSEHKDDETALGQEHIGLLYLPTPDTRPLSIEQLRQGATWVNTQIEQGHKVLIHCEHGVGRSVLLTAAALVGQGMNAHDAITLIQRRRWQAAPNHRQMQRLQEFERAIRSQAQASQVNRAGA